MAREFEKAVLKIVAQITGGLILEQVTSQCRWLSLIGPVECGRHWSCIGDIYHELTGENLPEAMPPSRQRRVDGVLQLTKSAPRIVEADESQHFNCYRAATFRFYSPATALAFDRDAWIERSLAKTRLEGGGWGKPKPPLFDFEHGRHRERAFRDALCDILPADHGFLPTLRIAYFEVPWSKRSKNWIDENEAHRKIEKLLRGRISN